MAHVQKKKNHRGNEWPMNEFSKKCSFSPKNDDNKKTEKHNCLIMDRKDHPKKVVKKCSKFESIK